MTFRNIATAAAGRPPARVRGRRYSRRVSPRARVLAIVGLAAAAAVAAVVGVTLLQTRGESTVPAGAVDQPRAGSPPLQLDFGVRADAEARALAQAQRAYDKGKVAQAAAVFARYHSLEAQIGSAFAAWTKGGGLDAVKRIVGRAPEAARSPSSTSAGRTTGRAATRTRSPPGRRRRRCSRTRRTPSTRSTRSTRRCRSPGCRRSSRRSRCRAAEPKLPAGAAARPAAVAAAAKPAAGADDKLLYGLALWNLRRPVSAERAVRRRGEARPRRPGRPHRRGRRRLLEGEPGTGVRQARARSPASSRRSPVVRFHLGLLLLWNGERTKAARQLRLAVADGPQTVYAKNAKVLLASLGKTWDQVRKI